MRYIKLTPDEQRAAAKARKRWKQELKRIREEKRKGNKPVEATQE
jgi:hypothetical protein